MEKFLGDAYTNANVGIGVGIGATSFSFFPVSSSLQN